ncbi:hypothetical protein [Nitrosomonas sp. Nm33]|uniref:hypothetical protein n=1 Tax=Nitrosomonas sp. Nm33 TaxID=133724 RepID=UPI0008977093|nr:hypothetical protein [Nitrosomonas sp. Nm33]SDY09621.1 hypothetical protein SAMN05421755_100730 [Nitrosomonas sp. Nm33]
MEITIHQQIYYSNKDLVPIREIAEGLLALEAVIKQSPKVLESLFPGTKIESVEVFINELKSDSIWESFVIKFVFGSQDKFDQFVTNLREKVGMDNIMNNPNLFTSILITMLLIGGAYSLGKSDSEDKVERIPVIEANNNTIINIGAGMMEMDAKDFRTIIEGAIKDKNQLARNTIDVIKPAKRDPDATITFDKNDDLKITANTIKAMPKQHKETEREELIEDFKSIFMEVRAIDLDSQKTGWAAIIPDLGTRRIRLQLDPTINLEEVFEKRRFNGNVTVVFRYDKYHNKIPYLVFLREINE